ncbi:hypothetical protein ACEPT7_03670 [Burkholderia ubonensis]|uniref:hypothetical protein n=1 Tax=Burkholderia ubonensis TaxID=101571 RepID=UPI00358FBF1A
MATDITETSFGDKRAACDAALQMLARGNDLRDEWQAFHQRRIKRDRDATLQLREAIADAKDWRAFNDACQRIWREYVQASTTIWQDAGMRIVRAQYECASASAGLLRECQTIWLHDWSHLAGTGKGVAGWRDWMDALERMTTETVRPDGGMTTPARRRAGANTSRGEAHAS